MRYILAGLIFLLFAVTGVFAEDFAGRPTITELNEIVVLGTHCVRGVNERCWATQYQSDPVACRIEAPFTNASGWYLDQNTMQALDATVQDLVPYYVEPTTAYHGTTNIAMLTVTGLWAQLEVGDCVNQFTGNPASGTNPPTYGDYPWRFYVANLEERYEVLNALNVVKLAATNDLWTRDVYPGGEYWNTWAECRAEMESRFASAVFDKKWSVANSAPGTLEGATRTPRYRLSIAVVTGSMFCAISTELSGTACDVYTYGCAKPFTYWPEPNWEQDGNGIPLIEDAFALLGTANVSGASVVHYYFPQIEGLPHPTSQPPEDEGGGATHWWTARGWQFSPDTFMMLGSWHFNYCADR